MTIKPPPWQAVAALALFAAALALMLVGCHDSPPARPVVAAPPAEAPAPAPAAEAPRAGDAPVDAAAVELRDARKALAAARQRVTDAEEGLKAAQEDARRRVTQAQALWATWIAGLVVLGGVVLTVLSFVWGFPRRWGAILGASGAGLLVAARAWAWMGDHALAGALLALAAAGLVVLYLLWRAFVAVRLTAAHADRMEKAETDTDVIRAKIDAATDQARYRVRGLIQRARGKA